MSYQSVPFYITCCCCLLETVFDALRFLSSLSLSSPPLQPGERCSVHSVIKTNECSPPIPINLLESHSWVYRVSNHPLVVSRASRYTYAAGRVLHHGKWAVLCGWFTCWVFIVVCYEKYISGEQVTFSFFFEHWRCIKTVVQNVMLGDQSCPGAIQDFYSWPMCDTNSQFKTTKREGNALMAVSVYTKSLWNQSSNRIVCVRRTE